MMNESLFLGKVRKKLLHLRLRPIRVFCFHQVSDVFDSDTMWECDWTQIEDFKRNILVLKKKYTFVSLEKAYGHIVNDKIRVKNYAVLTADDGWASLKSILPWLAEQEVPVTLFLNPMYMDGIHCQSRNTEQFLTTNEVVDIVEHHYPYISIASHGWTHDDCSRMTFEAFQESVVRSEDFLNQMKGKIPFYAFTFGRYAKRQMGFLKQQSLTPVLIDGMMNYDGGIIHRESIDEGKREPEY